LIRSLKAAKSQQQLSQTAIFKKEKAIAIQISLEQICLLLISEKRKSEKKRALPVPSPEANSV